MIKPKKITISDIDGIEHNFIIYRFEAMKSFYLISKALPFISSMIKGDNWQAGEEEEKELYSLLGKVLAYTEKVTEKGSIKLDGYHTINNHVPDIDTLLSLIKELNDYNTDFFKLGKIFNKLKEFKSTIDQLITKISNL